MIGITRLDHATHDSLPCPIALGDRVPDGARFDVDLDVLPKERKNLFRGGAREVESEFSEVGPIVIGHGY